MDYFDLFGTKDAALAFVQGFEAAVTLIDDDHAFCEPPFQTVTGDWKVEYGFHV
jgi:hypothetical protein